MLENIINGVINIVEPYRLRVSQIGYCILQNYRLYNRKENKIIKEDALRRMFIGTASHDYMRINMESKDNILVIDKEIEVYTKIDNHIISGTIDLIIKNIKSNKTYVVDYKFVDINYYKNIKEAPQHYIDQIMMYGYIAKENGIHIDKCILVFICKNTNAIKEYEIEIDNNRIKELLDKYRFILAGGGEPDKPYNEPEWECNYCQYYYECWKQDKQYEKLEDIVNYDNDEYKTLLCEEYADNHNNIKMLNNRNEEIKEELIYGLQGKTGDSKYVKLTYVPPVIKKIYNVNKLNEENKTKIEEEKTTSGYYKVYIKKQ
jgi:CRISPR/Cas system-associated exonuclease Cas4 (RecB family)